jgi:hypothetical protein
VSSLSIREEEEGAVMYFVLRHAEDSNKDQVLSLGKFKTLEYRLFRKMREKLRNFNEGLARNSPDQAVQAFIKQSRELCRDPAGRYYELPHPLDYYIDLCILAFRLTTKGPNKEVNYFQDLLMNEYVHFLEELISVFEEENREKTGKYVGLVSFNSRLLENQDAISYLGPPGSKFKAPALTKAAGPNRAQPVAQ